MLKVLAESFKAQTGLDVIGVVSLIGYGSPSSSADVELLSMSIVRQISVSFGVAVLIDEIINYLHFNHYSVFLSVCLFLCLSVLLFSLYPLPRVMEYCRHRK